MALADLAKPDVRQFLSRPLFAALATLNADGTPQLTYVWYTLDGQDFLISTTKDRVKYRNVVRNPHVALAILDPADPYRYVSVDGTVQIAEQGAPDLIVEEAVRYMGEERGRAFAEPLRTMQRVILRVKPERAMVVGF